MTFRRGIRLGLIKGGQLGKMILQAAPSFDVHSVVMDNDPHCPCRHLCSEFVLGDSMNFSDVVSFGHKVDVLTVEFEHVNTEALLQLKKDGVHVYPDPFILAMVQNKAKQKEFYRTYGIPTAEYRLVPNRLGINAHLDFLPAIQKTCMAGYDGKGVYKIGSEEDLAGAFDQPSLLEHWVDVDREIAVLIARGIDGNTAIYPTVEMVFHPQKNLVEFLFAPADISPKHEQEARKLATDIAHRLNMVGVLAVEMFITKGGEVLVNEIAPRVHNSGHHTIEGVLTSQFEQHVRAVLGLPLGPVDTTSCAVMVNILGDDGYEGLARYEGVEAALALGHVFVHLYGKNITKPFRKMGHATILASNRTEAMAKAQKVKELIKVRA